jgi:hypothetical protein
MLRVIKQTLLANLMKWALKKGKSLLKNNNNLRQNLKLISVMVINQVGW